MAAALRIQAVIYVFGMAASLANAANESWPLSAALCSAGFAGSGALMCIAALHLIRERGRAR